MVPDVQVLGHESCQVGGTVGGGAAVRTKTLWPSEPSRKELEALKNLPGSIIEFGS